jgi:hypothetical protein
MPILAVCKLLIKGRIAKIFVQAYKIFSLVLVTSTLSSLAKPRLGISTSNVANRDIPRSVVEIPG